MVYITVRATPADVIVYSSVYFTASILSGLTRGLLSNLARAIAKYATSRKPWEVISQLILWNIRTCSCSIFFIALSKENLSIVGLGVSPPDGGKGGLGLLRVTANRRQI